ncbi:MAG: lasso RiPP family leader peptide-containing protein [Pseudomonadota bacterium]
MKQHQKSQGNDVPGIHKKKSYSKPVLTILGKISELTAGGSGHPVEHSQGKNPRS